MPIGYAEKAFTATGFTGFYDSILCGYSGFTIRFRGDVNRMNEVRSGRSPSVIRILSREVHFRIP